MKDISELLLPRVKVIAPYPLSHMYFNVGDILTWDEKYESYRIFEKQVAMAKETIESYPHLFKPLAWYEDREESQMPEYVKFVKNYMNYKKGQVYKYSNWSNSLRIGEIGFMIDANSKEKYGNHVAMPANFDQFMPATETEYNQYISKPDYINKK